MYAPDKITGLRFLFNLVTENNEGVELYGLRGSVDNEIYVRIRGKDEDTGMFKVGAGPKSKWNPFKSEKTKKEMSKTFEAVLELVRETKGEVKTEDFIKRLRNSNIYVQNNFVEMNDFQLICEIYDPVFVEYKGGRKQIGKSDTSSSTAKKEIKVDINLEKKVKEEKEVKAQEKDKRGIQKKVLTSDTTRG